MSSHRIRGPRVAAVALLAVAAVGLTAPVAAALPVTVPDLAVPAAIAHDLAVPDLGVPAAAGVRLTLTVADGESPAPIARMATLRCRPSGGTHPQAARVCSSLVMVGGTPHMLGMSNAMACTLMYDPVTVSVTGFADGRPVDHQRTYGNACAMLSETGPLFEF